MPKGTRGGELYIWGEDTEENNFSLSHLLSLFLFLSLALC